MKKNEPENTQVVGGAEHIHFHHKTSDQLVALGRPCTVEMVCHACHKSALVIFKMSAVTIKPTPIHAEKIDKLIEVFTTKHRDCPPLPREDYKRYCPRRREGTPEVYDLAGALGS